MLERGLADGWNMVLVTVSRRAAGRIQSHEFHRKSFPRCQRLAFLPDNMQQVALGRKVVHSSQHKHHRVGWKQRSGRHTAKVSQPSHTCCCSVLGGLSSVSPDTAQIFWDGQVSGDALLPDYQEGWGMRGWADTPGGSSPRQVPSSPKWAGPTMGTDPSPHPGVKHPSQFTDRQLPVHL